MLAAAQRSGTHSWAIEESEAKATNSQQTLLSQTQKEPATVRASQTRALRDDSEEG